MPAVESSAIVDHEGKGAAQVGQSTVVEAVEMAPPPPPLERASRTAPTRNKGCGAMPPRGQRSWPAVIFQPFDGIWCGVGTTDLPGQQRCQQRRSGIERDRTGMRARHW